MKLCDNFISTCYDKSIFSDDTAPICDVERETSLEEVVTPQTTPNVETSKGNDELLN